MLNVDSCASSVDGIVFLDSVGMFGNTLNVFLFPVFGNQVANVGGIPYSLVFFRPGYKPVYSFLGGIAKSSVPLFRRYKSHNKTFILSK